MEIKGMMEQIFHDGKKVMLVIKNLETEQNDL
jgi:hypothetical protein